MFTEHKIIAFYFKSKYFEYKFSQYYLMINALYSILHDGQVI